MCMHTWVPTCIHERQEEGRRKKGQIIIGCLVYNIIRISEGETDILYNITIKTI